MFSCEFCEISKNTFFTKHVWTTASSVLQIHGYSLLFPKWLTLEVRVTLCPHYYLFSGNVCDNCHVLEI